MRLFGLLIVTPLSRLAPMLFGMRRSVESIFHIVIVFSQTCQVCLTVPSIRGFNDRMNERDHSDVYSNI